MTPVANANRAALFASMVRADTGFLDFFIPPAEKKIWMKSNIGKPFYRENLLIGLSIYQSKS